MGSLTPFFKKISPTVGLTVWAVSRLCTVLGVTIDVLNQDGLRGKKIKRGILLAAVHIIDNCKETTCLQTAKSHILSLRLPFVFAEYLPKLHPDHHIMKTVLINHQERAAFVSTAILKMGGVRHSNLKRHTRYSGDQNLNFRDQIHYCKSRGEKNSVMCTACNT